MLKNVSKSISNIIMNLIAVLIIILLVISVVCTTIVPLIVEFLYSSPYDYPNTRWSAEELNLWFEFPENQMAYGLLNMGNESYSVFMGRTGRSLAFDIFTESDSGSDIYIFRCVGKWNGDEFSMKVIEDYFNLGYTTITLYRVD